MSWGRSVVALGATTLAVCAAAVPAGAVGATFPARQTTARTAVSARAATAQIRWVCRGPADVFDTPGGVVIGILARGDRVRVLLHSAEHRRWVLVHGPIEIHGWMTEGSLC